MRNRTTSMPTLIQVAIVEDQRDVREGLRFMIHHVTGFRCVASELQVELLRRK